jgi:LysR family transcriptional regulator, low CO2-responsive transcriptional regulator
VHTDWLQTFRLVARFGSFTRAGERLFMSQPGVSAQIRHLEHAFGAELFERRGGGKVTLTSAGEAVLDFADAFDELLFRTQASISDGGPAEPISIGSSNTPATYVLPTLIAEFRKLVPEAVINIVSLDLAEAKRLLLAGNLDFAVMADADFSEELAVQPLVTTRLWIVARPDHPLAAVEEVAPQSIAENPIVLLGHGMESNRLAKLWASSHGVELHVALESSSHDQMKEAVKLGLGLAFAGGPGVLREIQEGNLAVLKAPGTPIELPLYLAHRRDVHSVTKAKFVACVRASKWRANVPAFI